MKRLRRNDGPKGSRLGIFLLCYSLSLVSSLGQASPILGITAHVWPDERTGSEKPSAAVDGSLNTYTWCTRPYTNRTNHLGLDFGRSECLSRIRLWKDNYGDWSAVVPKNLTIQYTTDVGPMSARSWRNVSNLTNGFQATELLHANAVNANGTVTYDNHDSHKYGWASLTFDSVEATGVRITFSNAVAYPYVHYRVYEFQAHFEGSRTPVIAPISDESISEATPYVGPLPTLFQCPTDAVTWSLVDPPHADISIDSDSGIVTWERPIARTEPYVITIRATNGFGYGEQSWSLTVLSSSYTAEVLAVDPSRAPCGTSVSIFGRATWQDTGSAAGTVSVAVYIRTKGIGRRVETQTDASGNFQITWQPLANEAGRYFVWAQDESGSDETPEDEFVLFGAEIERDSARHKVVAGQTVQGSAMVRNLGDVELTGLTAQVSDVTGDLAIDLDCPESLDAEACAPLTYTITATGAPIKAGQVEIVVSSAGATLDTFHIDVEVVPVPAELTASPTPVIANMVRGKQTFVDIKVTNTGGSPTGDLAVQLPNAAWLSLVTPAHIASLDPNEGVTVTLLLTPSETAVLGPYTGSVGIGGLQVAMEVPFVFACISDAVASLTVTAVDELTYYGEGNPNVGGAQVTISDPYTGQTIAQDVTDSSGVAAFANLPEAYYDVEVTAEAHGTFRTTVLLSAGDDRQVIAFLPGQFVTYRWTVIPTDIPDRYHFTVEADFVANVPVPVIEIEPLLKDVCKLTEEETQVDYTITNHGLLAAKDAQLIFNNHAGFEFTPLVDKIDVPAQASVTVPVLVRNTKMASGEPGPCSECGQCDIGRHELVYHLKCGDDDLVYHIPFFTKACLGPCTLPAGGGSGGGGPVSEFGQGERGGGEGNGGGGGSELGPYVEVPVPPLPPMPPCLSCDARVRIRIDQDMVLTRHAFRAILELNNGDTGPLEQVSVALAIHDANGQSSDELFGIHPPELIGLNDVGGGSSLPPGQSAVAQWLIVAAPEAAPCEARRYTVSGELSYSLDGQRVQIPLYPAPITVLPSPQLEVKHFLERDVYSDDPFTDIVEPAVPFSLGLMMINHGCAPAEDVEIVSAQPRIISNEAGLLVNFEIIGASVCPQPVAPSLKVSLGDIEPDECKVARWLMQASLQGYFEDYDANYVHLDGLGNRSLSSVDEVSIHELIHVVRGTCPQDDGVCDFLTNENPETQALPNAVHLSDGSVAPVTVVLDASYEITETMEQVHVSVRVPNPPAGYFYVRLPDPTLGNLPLIEVVRSDGVELPLGDNAWTTHRIIRQQGQQPYQENFLHLFDCNSTGAYEAIYGCDLETTSLTISSGAGGTVVEPNLGTFVYCGPTDVNVCAEADPDWEFWYWTGTAVDHGKVADVDAACTRVLVDASYTLEAHFREMAPLIRTDEADGIACTTARLNATLLSEGHDACQCWFQYWTEGEETRSATAKKANVETGEQFSDVIIGLQPATTYYFEAHASNSLDSAAGEIGSFTTKALSGWLRISATTGGTVDEPGIGEFSYCEPTTVPVHARVTDSCYAFAHWAGTAVVAGKVTDPNAPDTTVLVDGDYTLEAHFARLEHTLTLTSGKGGSVATPGEGEFAYDCGTFAPVEAQADVHYRFAGWTGTAVETGKVVAPSDPNTTVSMDADYTLQANFAAERHTLAVTSNEGGWVYVVAIGDGFVEQGFSDRTFNLDYGTTVLLLAIPRPGYVFHNIASWSGSFYSTTPCWEFPLEQDWYLTATFVAEP